LVKSGEKTFSKEIEQAYDKALADVIADAASPYAKKLESAGVKTIEDLANLEGKGFTKEEVQAFTQDLLKRAAKVVDQFAPEAAQDLIDKTFKESSSYVNTMKRVDRAMSSFMDGVPAEKVEGVKKHISALEASKLSIINSKALSQTEKEIAARRIDEAIASLESKLAQGVDNAAAAALKVSEEQAKRLTDELAKSFGNVEELFTVPLEKVKSMAEAAGWPKEEVNKFIKLVIIYV
jgi:Asp-tRNA(Asn)/Glu-tRNA(Gln) amidotransferase C subunit